jgi:ankyrin repeat protein
MMCEKCDSFFNDVLPGNLPIDAKDGDGRTALMYASRDDNHECVRLLLSAGADVDAKENDGWTALMFASHYDNHECVNHLLSAGADVDAKDGDGLTALTIASYNYNHDCVAILTSHIESLALKSSTPLIGDVSTPLAVSI